MSVCGVRFQTYSIGHGCAAFHLMDTREVLDDGLTLDFLKSRSSSSAKSKIAGGHFCSLADRDWSVNRGSAPILPVPSFPLNGSQWALLAASGPCTPVIQSWRTFARRDRGIRQFDIAFTICPNTPIPQQTDRPDTTAHPSIKHRHTYSDARVYRYLLAAMAYNPYGGWCRLARCLPLLFSSLVKVFGCADTLF